MTKILLVTPFYDPNIVGGAEISTQMIAENTTIETNILTASGRNNARILHGITIQEKKIRGLSGAWVSSLQGNDFSLGNKVGVNTIPHFPIPHLVHQYRRFIEINGYDFVIANANIDLLARASLWKAAALSDAKFILVLRDQSLLRKRILSINLDKEYRKIIKSQFSYIDGIIAPTKYMIDSYAKFGLEKRNSVVIPNAVSHFSVDQCAFNDKTGVMYAGGLTENKGINSLLNVSHLFWEPHGLFLYGRGPLSDACKQVPNVTVLPWLPNEEVRERMAKSKVVVLPSTCPEAFGRILVEAVYSGTLPVGSSAGGIPEVLGGDHRYIFPAGDEEALLDRVNRILSLNEDQYHNELVQMQAYCERYSLTINASNWETCLKGWSRYD